MDAFAWGGFDGVDGAVGGDVVDHDDVADAGGRDGVDGEVAGGDGCRVDFLEWRTPGWCKTVAGSSGRVTTVKLTSDGSDSFAMSGNLGRFDSFQVRSSPSILFGDAPSAYATADTVDVGTLVDPLLANFAYATTAPGFKVKAQRWTIDPTGATWESQTNTPASTSGGVGADHRLYEIQICTKAI